MKNTILEKWAMKLRIRMLENHIKQCEIAKRMNVSNAYLSMVMNGHYDLTDAKKKIGAVIDEIIKERKLKG